MSKLIMFSLLILFVFLSDGTNTYLATLCALFAKDYLNNLFEV